MTVPHLRKHYPGRRAADRRPRYLLTKGCWNEPEPVNLRKGLLMVSLGLVLNGVFVLESSATGTGEGVVLLLFASSLLFLGCISLLLELGQKLVTRLRSIKKHCGCCCFYEAQDNLYAIGRCQADPSRHVVSRSDTCPSFCFSERAMVRERLARRPHVLKQLQVVRISDVANRRYVSGDL